MGLTMKTARILTSLSRILKTRLFSFEETDTSITIYDKEYDFTEDEKILVKEQNRIIALEGDSMIESLIGLIVVDHTSRFGFKDLPFIAYKKLHFVPAGSLENFSTDPEYLYNSILEAKGTPTEMSKQLNLPKKFLLSIRAMNRKFARKVLIQELTH